MTEADVSDAYDRYGRARLWLLGLIALVVLIGTGGTLWLLVSDDAKRADSRAAIALLVECTTPPGERTPPVDRAEPDDCFTRTQSRTGDVVSQIGDLSIIAAACGAANPGDIPATRRCVEEALK